MRKESEFHHLILHYVQTKCRLSLDLAEGQSVERYFIRSPSQSLMPINEIYTKIQYLLLRVLVDDMDYR